MFAHTFQISSLFAVAPNVTEPYQSYNILVNKDVMLYCDVTGFPDPEISWFVNNVPISPNHIKYSVDSSSGSLQILSPTVEDTAVYECRATNPAGSAVGEFDLTIVGTFIRFKTVCVALFSVV